MGCGFHGCSNCFHLTHEFGSGFPHELRVGGVPAVLPVVLVAKEHDGGGDRRFEISQHVHLRDRDFLFPPTRACLPDWPGMEGAGVAGRKQRNPSISGRFHHFPPIRSRVFAEKFGSEQTIIRPNPTGFWLNLGRVVSSQGVRISAKPGLSAHGRLPHEFSIGCVYANQPFFLRTRDQSRHLAPGARPSSSSRSGCLGGRMPPIFRRQAEIAAEADHQGAARGLSGCGNAPFHFFNPSGPSLRIRPGRGDRGRGHRQKIENGDNLLRIFDW